MEDCIFCKIANKEMATDFEYESENVVAFKSIEPVAEHHVLIIPKEHIETFLDLEKNHAAVLMQMAETAQKVIDKKKIADGYKLVFNGGKYQSISHIHWHLLGGKLEDQNNVLNKT